MFDFAGVDFKRHDIRRADLDALTIQVALIEIAQVDQRLSVDHLQHTALAMCDADLATDAVARVDGQRGIDRALAARIFLDEFADGAGSFAAGRLIETGIIAVKAGL